ncbi:MULTISPECIES: hypothetical protein [Brevibacillus]|jgi:hypothetical protein|uniref:hypothetical protein n=1 Tax=Brevibacillus TaxID=55080 RepID=UPI001562209A|nr:hypothetical protein [Brevibacillus borstelensis]MBE5393919.1 hypothetical protein [Brevibacillus borstelensis]MED1747185.1 hypothetical protein [Brevibacillus borstelensis]MED1855109.1 hypothetical protein [Brevibacillus borstelensis]MED1876961.1 hypothetical protein [Brevibacillus borstelensis]WNF04732.1 hypothetical protein RFB14_20395 [Brevibacillus borstelensis]
MKKIIEKKLQVLIGLPVENAGRSGNLTWFSFGKTKKITSLRGIEKRVGEHTLNVQCSWRITKEHEIIVASKDIYIPNKEWVGKDEEFVWDKPGMNRYDERIIKFKALNILVDKIEADDLGGIKVYFSDRYLLELFPDSSSEEEFWRFFVPGELNSHFVVKGSGIED